MLNSTLPVHLRCEYLEQPLGIDELQPCLSWTLESSRRNVLQSAYQIHVTTEDGELCWDSGRVPSDAMAHIVYAGVPLVSRARYHWRVRVWDEAGAVSAWSDSAHWEMGLLEASDWQAQWIGFDSTMGVALDEPLPATYLRSSFAVNNPVKKARLYITARGLYIASLNGQRLGDAALAPGWTDYAQRIEYQTLDVTAAVQTGENALGVILGEGWYAGFIGYKNQRRHYGALPQLLAQLELDLEDGTHQIVSSSGAWGQWRVTTGAIRHSDFLMGETFDARLEHPGWDTAGYDASGWQPVYTFAANSARLVAQKAEPIRVLQERKPLRVSRPSAGVHVFDMGQNMVGWARLRVSGTAGQTVQLRFAEMLQADGTLYTDSLRSAKSTDTFILKGEGLETFEPHFSFHGFRFVELTGFGGTPDLETITGVVVGSDTPDVGSFESSNELVNQLFSNIRWSQRSNFLSVPTDCPQRDERLGWLGDAQIFARTATFNADVAAFFTKWLQDVRDAQSPSGGYSDVAPRVVDYNDAAPAWGDAGIIVPWTLYEVYGDTRIVDRQWQSMCAWMNYIAQANPNHLWLERRNFNFGDWLSVDAITDKDVLATAYWAYDAQLMARMARATGRDAEALEFDALFLRIREAFSAAFVQPDGWVRGRTQTAQVLALHFDLVPEDQRERVTQRLLEDIAARNHHLSTGFVGVGYLCPTLTGTGHLEMAYRLLLNETFPSWGFSIRMGATSIWERWDGWTPEGGFQDAGMNSFNHYSLGSVGQWLYQTVAGIDNDAPGYRRIRLSPRPGGGITHAKAAYNSISGLIESHWRLEGERFAWRVTIPANTTATLRYPIAGARILESGAPFHDPRAELVGGFWMLELGSGRYEFSSDVPVAQEVRDLIGADARAGGAF
jgi:alpha-L-rhamnosidase